MITDARLQELIRSADLGRAGIVVGVARGSDAVIAAHRAESSTQLYAASIAKQVTAVVLAQLELQGRLSLNDTVSSHVPGLHAWAEQVTLMQLMQHLAGLPNEVPGFKPKRAKAWTHEIAMEALGRFVQPLAAPGAQFTYSGLGYVLLAEVVDRLERGSINGSAPFIFRAAKLFEPLQLSQTCFWNLWGPGDEVPSAQARPTHRRFAAPLSYGDGGLWTTVPDLLRWGQAMNADTFGVAGRIRTTAVLNDATDAGYGGGVRAVRTPLGLGYSHGGSWPGALSKLVWIPETDAVVAILSTTPETASINVLTDKLIAELARS